MTPGYEAKELRLEDKTPAGRVSGATRNCLASGAAARQARHGLLICGGTNSDIRASNKANPDIDKIDGQN